MVARVVTGTTAATTITGNDASVNVSRNVAGIVEVMAAVANAASVPIYRATISSTFTGISMAVAGLTDLVILHDTMLASEELGGVFDFELHETIIAGDSTEVIWNQTLTDTINVSEDITHDWIAHLSDTATVGEVAGPVIWDANLWPEPAVGSWAEEITVFLSEFITDAVNVTDTFPLIGRTLEIGDTFTATEEITASSEHAESLVGTLEASETLVHGIFEELTIGNTILATDTFTDQVSPNTTFVETFFATNTMVLNADVNATLTDTIVALEELILASYIANTTLCDTLTASEVLWASDFGASAWVLNTETAGLSTYDNFGFNSVAVVGGVLYATSPEGVFALNADKDQTRDVAAKVKTGMLDFDIKTTKRISDIFVGYTGGRLSYEVETYDGPQDVYTYEMPERDSEAPRNNRVKPGKGLKSRYWRFGIENIDGADFQLHDQTAVIAASKRRL
jgi:hypothetical protein